MKELHRQTKRDDEDDLLHRDCFDGSKYIELENKGWLGEFAQFSGVFTFDGVDSGTNQKMSVGTVTLNECDISERYKWDLASIVFTLFVGEQQPPSSLVMEMLAASMNDINNQG